MKCVVGIDPGYFGAIAFYRPLSSIVVCDMPLSFDKHKKKNIDAHTLARLFDSSPPGEIAFAAIERVHSMPGQGVTSMFNFGEGFGIIKGVLGAFQIPYVEVDPGVWKNAMGLGADKAKSLALARKKYGNEYFSRKKDHGRAEAALLAQFAYERLGKGYGI